MKEIFYDDKHIFLLTNEEFMKAVKAWDEKKDFWCIRLEAMMTRRFRYAGTPREELGFEVFVLRTKNGLKKIYKKNEKYYQLLRYTDAKDCVYSPLPKIEKNIIKDLIPQDEFYKNEYAKQSVRSLPSSR